jgi:hypothetical protein
VIYWHRRTPRPLLAPFPLHAGSSATNRNLVLRPALRPAVEALTNAIVSPSPPLSTPQALRAANRYDSNNNKRHFIHLTESELSFCFIPLSPDSPVQFGIR